MSLWGYLKLAPHVYLLISNDISLEECQEILFHEGNLTLTLWTLQGSSLYPLQGIEQRVEQRVEQRRALVTSLISNINYKDQNLSALVAGTYKEIKKQKIRAKLRIGPHNKNILSILFGSLLGDAQAEFRLKGQGTRISFYQEGSHVSYLIWLHKLMSELGYCNTNLPQITTRLGKKGVVIKFIRFKT